MKEKREGEIRLEEITKASMEEVLDYLYTGHVEISKENAFELFAQVDYFLIPSLKALSGKFILQTLTIFFEGRSGCTQAIDVRIAALHTFLQPRAGSQVLVTGPVKFDF